MRLLIALIVIIYLVGVGVVLSPTIQGRWSSASGSDLTTGVAEALPDALAWPAKAFRSMQTSSGAKTSPVGSEAEHPARDGVARHE
jgi:hypothetical protein